MTQPAPVRRRLEQPSEEKAKRSGCLMWGGVLGVLVGIMVGIYALPPILKHYYGEKVVAAGEAYEGDGKVIRLLSVVDSSDEIPPSPGVVVYHFVATIVVRPEDFWEPEIGDFTLEFEELDDWQKAYSAEGNLPGALQFEAGEEKELRILFQVQGPIDEADALTPEALHLSDPRVKFEIAE